MSGETKKHIKRHGPKKIEITPEMIKAGVGVLDEYEDLFSLYDGTARALVETILIAALTASEDAGPAYPERQKHR